MIQFIWPWAATLLPLPLIAYFALPAKNNLQDAALRVPFMDDFNGIATSQNSARKKPWLILLAVIAWCLLILAAMRPQWLGDSVELPVSGRDLMMAVDLSGSMQMEDFTIEGQTVNRLQATKYVASKFIEKRVGDRVGLILFGRQAYLQTPLTFDRKTVNTLLLEAEIGLAGKETAIGDAIGLAIKRLKDKDKESRVLILLTDGANTAGEISPIKAAELAALNGLKIYTIGIGADEIIRRTFFGSQRINPSADLDEITLTAIATKTGGRYFRARDTKELQKIYSLLNKLEPSEKESQYFRPISALYYWPLGAAFILAILISLFKIGLSQIVSVFKFKSLVTSQSNVKPSSVK